MRWHATYGYFYANLDPQAQIHHLGKYTNELISSPHLQVNGAVLLIGNVFVVASPLLGYRLASYTWLIWMGCLVPFLVGYALSKASVPTQQS